MYRAPSKHGLDRKFKSWRKGKSEHSKNRSSLKKQLRGYERLLSKLTTATPKNNDDDDGNNDKKKKTDEGEKDVVDNDALQTLQQKIDDLKQEIAQKQQSIQEKKNAEKAHGQRFMDRQRLTRQEKQVRKQKDTKEKEQILQRLALDQVYVAHHPMDVKYMPLFKRGQRVVEYSRTLYRRAVTRKRILRDLGEQQRVAWIPSDQYERLPETWSIQDEERVFGGSIGRPSKTKKSDQVEDARFAMATPQQEAVLKAAEKVESDLKKTEQEKKILDNTTKDYAKEESSDSSSSSGSHDSDSGSGSHDSDSDDDDDDPVDPLQRTKSRQSSIPPTKKDLNENPSSSDSDSDSSSDSDSDDSDDKDEENQKTATQTPVKRPPPPIQDSTKVESGDDDDDFLMDAKDSTPENVFETSQAQEIPAWSSVRGDKSKGWQTQMQRPGEFQKRKKRKTWK
ncbi:rRNA-processing protein Efg1 [Nitzschia inconspicua]|uniref:rRNA-processing protein Efg1 n=1 Tax=Nitzschia inconspicua TaxID=303405 RepID=A0A9K3Q821_9STRA|nr:rRNA-processing protein Efg1 [Nitzschia inconspicua]